METFPGLSRVYLAKNGVRGSQSKDEKREPGAYKNTHAQLNVLALGQSCETPKCFLYCAFTDSISHLGSKFRGVDQYSGFSQPCLLTQ